MAKFEFKGIDKYIDTLQKLGGKNTESILKYAVYPGAGIAADAIRSEIEANHRETRDLAKSLTLTSMRNDNGFVNTKVSFGGYDRNGVPNALKAAALESGTSRGIKATHFISKTVKSVSERAEEAMQKALDEKIGQILDNKKEN